MIRPRVFWREKKVDTNEKENKLEMNEKLGKTKFYNSLLLASTT